MIYRVTESNSVYTMFTLYVVNCSIEFDTKYLKSNVGRDINIYYFIFLIQMICCC